jgi:2-amino-4-hydroxy-6-hydroxymethyldihydropteridine diphosphokinase
MARCLIGCGSNLGQRREQLDRAVELLRFMPGIDLRAVSSFRETRPVGGPAGQSSYLNGACLIETDLTPHDVLGMLTAVEHTLDRQRERRWSARTIDLDLLLYDDLVLQSPDLTVPHPRMATRRFVLEPSVEIAGDLHFPTAACTLDDLLASISAPCPCVAITGVPGSGTAEVAAAVADATMARLIRGPRSAWPAGWPVDTDGSQDADAWRRLVDEALRPIATKGWRGEEPWHPDGPADCGCSIADYWIDAFAALAQEQLPEPAREPFAAVFEARASTTVPPQVAILLVADAATFEERIGFLRHSEGRRSDLFNDLAPAALGDVAGPSVDALLRAQDRLEQRLLCPSHRSPRAPKAVVVIDSGDLAQAIGDATAAVEAML